MLHRIGVLAAALACAASTAGAQELVYARIPWGAPADSVRARMEAQGFEYGGVVGSGDRQFHRADGAAVNAMMRTGRVVGFYTLEPAAGAVDARFRAIADSLQGRSGRRWTAGPSSSCGRRASPRWW